MGMQPQQGHRLNQCNMQPRGPSGIITNMMHQEMPQPNALLPQVQVLLQQQIFQAMQSGVPHFLPVPKQQVFNSHPPPPAIHRYNQTFLGGDF